MSIEKSKNVPPFVRFCTANVPMVFNDSLSYYECLCALTNFIQKELVEVVNNNADLLAELNVKFDELKGYVDNYFDNLDVQEEINNKLDDMAESGDLATYIAQFVELGPLFTYDTLSDLVAADNLAAGCTARTLGKETLNDGFGAYYKIDTTGDIALDNGLYATLVDDFGSNNYYDEITISTGRDYNTDYYVATIPLNDSEGNLIAPYVNDETDTHTRGTLQYAQDEFTTLSLNAGLGRQNSQGTWIQGAIIANGVITRHDENDIPAPEWYTYMGIKADRSLVNFSGTTEPETMLAAGVVNAFLTFGQVVTNGVLTINEHRAGDGEDPLVFLGTKADGTMIILSTDGRTQHDYGISVTEGASKMLELGCTNAWNLDGGGSSSLVYKGSKQNRNIDENGTKDRGIWVTLNFKKPTIDKELAKVNSFIGKERQLLNKQIRDDMRLTYPTKKAFICFDMRSTGYNVAVDYDTVVPIKFEHSYTCNNSGYYGVANNKIFEELTDEGGKIIGFKYNRAGLLKVTITASVYCKSTVGNRKIFFAVGNPQTGVSAYTQMWEQVVPTGNNEYHTLTATFVANNGTWGQNFYISGNGQTGDDFCRTYVSIEELGIANS